MRLAALPQDRWVALACSAAGALVYVVFGWGRATDYDYFGRLAEAFLAGRWWLDEAPQWLNELVGCGDGRWCVVYPPLPALLSVPFVAAMDPGKAQVLVSQLAGGLSAGILYLALRAFGAPRPVAIAGTSLSAFGTTLLFTSADGRAWYAAHAVAVPFAAAALLLAARGQPGWAVGALLGCAALARLPLAAAAPALALLAARRSEREFPRVLGEVVLGGLPFALVYLGYNLLRWGTPLDVGYVRLTEGDVFFRFGLFSPLYLPRHLYAIFIEPPDFVEDTPWFLRPRFTGMSLILTTPAFLWCFSGLRWARRSAATAAVALAAGLALLPNVLHGTVGFQQFGYRFSLDAQPFLVALALAGDALREGGWRRFPTRLFLVVCALAIVVNVYAAIAIIRFGYWQ